MDDSITKYPEHIMKDLRERLGLEPDDTSKDAVINTYSPNEAFAEILNWNGLLGYDETIKNWLRDIYGIDVD